MKIEGILPPKCKVFQTDTPLPQRVYCENKNYLIEIDESCSNQDYCAIYFCSNDIYYPNTEEIFRKRIIEKNSYEWYGTRIKKAYKHIFVRDIFKQWYLTGINISINSPERLLEFLQKETQGKKVITVGSSAGAYAAILYGTQLNAVRIMAFNAQFELETSLMRMKESLYPLVYRLQNTDRRKYYDLKKIIDLDNPNIYYFTSIHSEWDVMEMKHVSDCRKLHILRFKTSHHGIPFLKVALERVLNLSDKELNVFEEKFNNPVVFTIRMVGVIQTIKGFAKQLKNKKKRRN